MQSTLHKVYDSSAGVFPKGWAKLLLSATPEQMPVSEQQQERKAVSPLVWRDHVLFKCAARFLIFYY